VELTVFTTGDRDSPAIDGVRTFASIGDFSLPEYPELKLHFPPILDVIDAFERGGFTKIHVSTPGTMGLLGLAIAKLMDVPIAATYHTDIPQYVKSLTNDSFLENTAWNYIIWFYNQMDEVLVPSKSTRDQLVERGLAPEKVRPLPRWVDTNSRPQGAIPSWRSYDMNGEIKFLYVGRISKEKNYLLADAFIDIIQDSQAGS
jgi:glycosyltransferase involved in cell wall biosynthesis